MEEPGSTRSKGATPVTLRLLLALGFVVAVGATVLAVLSEDARILRLAVVLALWAALIAAFAVTRSRRDAKAAALRENEAQLAYRLELHREVAARHEYEADLSVRMAAAQSEQIAELREQLDRLTEVLSSLADGELLVSRLTLSAESARFRAGQPVLAGPAAMQLPDIGRAVLAGAPQASIVDVAMDDGAAENAAVGKVAAEPPAPFVVGSSATPQPPADSAATDETAAHDVVLGPEPASEQAPAPVSGEPAPVAAEQVPEPAAAPEPGAQPEPEPEKSEPETAEPDSELETAEPHAESENAEPEPEPAPAPAPRPSRHAAPDDGAESPAAPAAPAAWTVPSRPGPESPGATSYSIPGSYSLPGFVTPEPNAPDDATAPSVSVPVATATHEAEPTEPAETDAVSVDELLAAYGLTGAPRRRRRE